MTSQGPSDAELLAQEIKLREYHVCDYMSNSKDGGRFHKQSLTDSDEAPESLLVYVSNADPQRHLYINLATQQAYFVPVSRFAADKPMLTELLIAMHASRHVRVTKRMLLNMIQDQSTTLASLALELKSAREVIAALRKQQHVTDRRLLEYSDELSAWVMRQRLESGLDSGDEDERPAKKQKEQ